VPMTFRALSSLQHPDQDRRPRPGAHVPMSYGRRDIESNVFNIDVSASVEVPDLIEAIQIAILVGE